MIHVAYGGGVNSDAVLCGLRERDIRPDLITFADTGGERPSTYSHVADMSGICMAWWGLPIVTVRKLYRGEFEGLERECLRKKMLPSLAYGRKACSMKYKIEPQYRALKEEMDRRGIKAARRIIGYDAGEGHRSVDQATEDLKCGRIVTNWYLLIELQWRRKECIETIKRHKLPVHGKTSCFFCPALRWDEIVALKQEAPDLFQRARHIESNAVLTSPGRGLGGSSLRWENVESNDEAQGKLWMLLDRIDPQSIPCGCYDGKEAA